jgi:DNA helicase II / ATP-dependent DNA helicase PcrA
MSFLDHLNPVQRDAVQAVDGPVMIVAGAGSGKTRVLTYRAAYLIERGVRPDAILALTFTNKAANEMKSRIVSLVGGSSRAIWMGTFHSIFARILRLECEKIGYERSFTIYDSDDSLALIKGIMNSLGISQQQYSPQGLRSRISTAKNQMLSPKGLRESGYDPMVERAAAVYEEYERKLRRSNAMDFDDLLLNPLELFVKHRDVLERYQYRFTHILVDEYQDTNRVQYRLIKELAARNKNVCVVGDDAQSIYAFRGADIRNILDFETDYPECKVFRLEQNYRSTKTILAAAGSLIRQNVHQIDKTLWTGNEDGEPVSLDICDDDRDEGYRVVNHIEEESKKRKLDLKDFAVLYRTNAQSRSIEDALRRNGIPYIIVGGVAFYKRKEIKDVLAYLRVVVNPRDEESLLRVINVPARAIGETTVRRVRTIGVKHGLPLFDVIGSEHLTGALPQKTEASVRAFGALLRKYIGLREQMSVGELARALVDDIGILQVLKEENTAESLSRRENILELISALTEFNDRRTGAKLEDFLEEVSLVSDIDTADFSRNAVTLMTLHAAKGLEFPVVFITGLEEGLFPIGSAVEDREQLEEERRLMYVGITRAMKKLFLLCAQRRYRSGVLSFSSRSRFLDEIDGDLITMSGGNAPRVQRPYRRGDHAEGGGRDRRQPVEPRAPAESSDQYFSDPLPSYEDESQETPQLHIGSRVVHESFGNGRVVGINGSGDQARAIVDFETVGRKHLMLKFAHLRTR